MNAPLRPDSPFPHPAAPHAPCARAKRTAIHLTARRSLVGGCLIALLTALCTPAAASVVEALPLRQLVAEADFVVVAQARTEQARRDGYGRIVTDVELTVEQALAGDTQAGDTLVVTTLGGTLADLGMHVEGAATLRKGDRALLFLRRTQMAGELRVVGMSQGALPVRENAGATVVIPGGAGQVLMRRSPDGTLQPGAPALQQARPFEELLAEVRSLIDELHTK